MPRLGLGMPIASDISSAPVVTIDDFLWENYSGSSGEIAINYQETRTNVVLHSQDTTDAEAWTKQNTAIDSTLYEAPDNSTTANAVKSNGTGEQLYTVSQSISVTAGKTYTASVHLKKENLTFVQLRFADSDGLPRAVFNLTTGAVTNAVNVIRTQVDAMDDDWYRCSITFVATTSSGSIKPFAQLVDNDGTPNIAVSGIVLIYVWGFQLEENIEASAYIPTVDAARTKTTTLNDFSKVWDFDSANIMPEVDPDSEGVWETFPNVVLNGNYEELGSELVTNGSFDTDSNWTFAGTNGAVSNGVGVFADTTNSFIIQSSVVPASVKQYKLQYEVIESNGGVSFGLSGGSSAFGSVSLTNSVGVHTKFITSNGSKTNLQFHNGGNFIGKIDNISVKKVDPNDRWTLTSGWSIEDGKATNNGSGGLLQPTSNSIVTGTTVVFKLTVSDRTTGHLRIQNNGSTIYYVNNINANGTFEHTFTTIDANGWIIEAVSGFDGKIDNVTVREYAIQPLNV